MYARPLSILFLCLYVSSAFSQSSVGSDLWVRVVPASPLQKVKPFPASANAPYPTDTLVLSNYGEPGRIVLGVGEQYSGQVAKYSVCGQWGVYAIGGHVAWGGDNTDTPLYETNPLSEGNAVTTKTYAASGKYPVHADIQAYCEDTYAGKIVTNKVSGDGVAEVFESIPVAAFTVTCGTTSPCLTARGGQTLSGIVTLSDKAINLGDLVLITVQGPGKAYPYMIITAKLNVGSFDIITSPVSASYNLRMDVVSGGKTFSNTVVITP